jgi:hypothetical protein
MDFRHYARLSDEDVAILAAEDDAVHAHVGFVGIFERGPLAEGPSGVNFERIRELIEDGLRRLPRFRQKLSYAGGSDAPIWVDDPHFNIRYHLRHTSLPVPGDERHLKRVVGRILSQKLDRAKPLWEFWVVEGLADDRFAVIVKVHRTLAGTDVATELLTKFGSANPEYVPPDPPAAWVPRDAPGPARLRFDNILHRAGAPGRALRSAAKVVEDPAEALEVVLRRTVDFGLTRDAQGEPPPKTRFDVRIGPHRRFDSTRLDFDGIEEIVSKHGGTAVDVVLAAVVAAIRNAISSDGRAAQRADFIAKLCGPTLTHIRCSTLEPDGENLLVRTPIAVNGSRQRYAAIVKETARAVAAGHDRHPRDANLVVEFRSGPDAPVYFAGSRLLELYPLTPLVRGHALAISALYYDGRVYCGINSDWEAMTGLHDFVGEVETEFQMLCKMQAPGQRDNA